jgi:uncharacterized protein (DUF1697 family)
MALPQLALLRGINVGGKNKLSMRDLAALFEEAGCENVSTFIQSGNVLFTASPAVSKDLASAIAAKIEKQFGYKTPVILRTAKELRDAIRNNPFLRSEYIEDHLHVMLLADRPDKVKIAALEPDRSPGDAFTVLGQEIYLQLPNGMGRTKLSNAWFDSKLATTSTCRNWRTVTKLLELLEA